MSHQGAKEALEGESTAEQFKAYSSRPPATRRGPAGYAYVWTSSPARSRTLWLSVECQRGCPGVPGELPSCCSCCAQPATHRVLPYLQALRNYSSISRELLVRAKRLYIFVRP